MQKLVYFLVLLFCLQSVAQNDILGKEYLKNGEYQKAQVIYKKLVQENPGRITYIRNLLKSYQQLEQYNEAEQLLTQKLTQLNYPSLWIDLGYNYQLKNDSIQAKANYLKAIEFIDVKVGYAYDVGKTFENYSLLDYAITAYQKGMELKPEYDFNMYLANIYGEQGNIEKMFNSYVNFLEKKKNYIHNIKKAFSNFLSEDKNNENNILLKKVLLKKIQENPDLIFNDLLSWLFVQQKEYNKAFTQEKAIFKRNPESLSRIFELAQVTANDNHTDMAISIYDYLIATTQDPEQTLKAEQEKLAIITTKTDIKNYAKIDAKYHTLLQQYGNTNKTIDLQVAYANFLAFYYNKPTEASAFLRKTLNLTLNKYQEALVKLKLADILVFEEKFNEALIYYTQIQRSLKNSVISQEARFKVAKTSYYKGDFKWAESQLKILKSSTSQLIANDALDLMLTIRDNKDEDSTQTALKLYAKADLQNFQNKKKEAIKTLNNILANHKTEAIIDETLLKQAQIFEDLEQYQNAEKNYLQIVNSYAEEILADDALYALAELYKNQLAQPEKAKQFYEQIIFNHQDSIYFIEARKNYRMLRGDAIN